MDALGFLNDTWHVLIDKWIQVSLVCAVICLIGYVRELAALHDRDFVQRSQYRAQKSAIRRWDEELERKRADADFDRWYRRIELLVARPYHSLGVAEQREYDEAMRNSYHPHRRPVATQYVPSVTVGHALGMAIKAFLPVVNLFVALAFILEAGANLIDWFGTAFNKPLVPADKE